MDNLIYAGLIAFGAFTTGMAAVAGVFYTKAMLMSRSSTRLKDHAKRHMWLAVTKLGIVVSQVVLLYRLISIGATDASGAAFFYLIGLSVTGVGVMGQAAALYKDMPLIEDITREEKNEHLG
jgi:hypothetical protein